MVFEGWNLEDRGGSSVTFRRLLPYKLFEVAFEPRWETWQLTQGWELW
jgi:hypothetical protein